MKQWTLFAAAAFLLFSEFLAADIYIKGGTSAYGYVHSVYSTKLYPARENSYTGDYEKVPDEAAVDSKFDPGESYQTEALAQSYFLEGAFPVGMRGLMENLMIGAGAGYISNPGLELDSGKQNALGNSSSWGFASVPVYGIAKYNFPLNTVTIPYAVLKAGINIPLQQDHTDIEEVNPGVYAGVGLGIEFSLVQFEILYSLSSVHIPDYSEHTTYSKTLDNGQTVEADGLIEGGNDYFYSQILLMAGIKLDFF